MSSLTTAALLFATYFMLVVATPVQNRTTDNGDIISTAKLPEYYLNSLVLNWEDAVRQCLQNGMQLVTLQTPPESENFQRWLRQQTDYAPSYWIGGRLTGNPTCEARPQPEYCFQWINKDGMDSGAVNPGLINLNFVGNINPLDSTLRVTIARDRYGAPSLGQASNTQTMKFFCQRN